MQEQNAHNCSSMQKFRTNNNMKEIAINGLLKAVEEGEQFYNNILSSDKYKHYQINLNCNTLVDPDEGNSQNNKAAHDVPKKVKVSFFREFDTFNIKDKPCLYFMELKKRPANLVEKFNIAKQKEKNKPKGETVLNYSAIKKHCPENSNILYVGKVKKDVGGRLSTHFGYANGKTGGLQLRSWAKELNLELIIHFIAFEEKIGNFINPLELEITKVLNPIIGKSK